MRSIQALLICSLFTLSSCKEGPVGRYTPDSSTPDTGDADVGECIQECGSMECGNDPKCGEPCGTCKSTERCDDSFKCVCLPPTDAELCAELDAECGTYTLRDRCDEERSVACGATCTGAFTCDEESRRCTCESPSPAEFCALAGAQCGTGSFTDRCDRVQNFDCGESCSQTQECASNQCRCKQESPRDLCERLDKDCGRLIARDLCDTVRIVEDCALYASPCSAPNVCIDNRCALPHPPSNDTCATPAELLTIGGYINFEVDTRFATQSTDGTCPGVRTGADLVYSVEVKEPSLLKVRADALDERVEPFVHLRSRCEDAGTELACAAATWETDFAEFIALLDEGIYYLWIDTPSPGTTEAGLLSITAELLPLLAPANDLCADATVLDLDAAQPVIYLDSSTLGAAFEAAATCSHTGSGDIYFALRPSEAMGLKVDALPLYDAYGLAVQPSFSLMNNCAEAGAETLCGADGALSISSLQAGKTALLRVSLGTLGELPRESDFTLRFMPVPLVENEDCDSGATLPDAVAAPFLRASHTHSATDDLTLPCSDGGGELVYYVEIPDGAEHNLTVTVTPDQGTPFRPALAIRSDCGDLLTELTCEAATADGPLSASAFRLTGGIYAVIVEAQGSTTGYFTLELSTPVRGTPPANDTCGGALPLSEHQEGSTVGANNDFQPSFLPRSGADVAWKFTVPAGETRAAVAYIEAKQSSPNYYPQIYIVQDCANVDDALAHGGGESTNMKERYQQLALASLGEGTYYLIVDGAEGSEGEYSLDFYQLPTGSNWTCGEAPLLTFTGNPPTARVVSSTQFGENVADSACVSEDVYWRYGIFPEGYTGRDLVWRIEPPAGTIKNIVVTAEALRGSNMVPVPALRTMCSDSRMDVFSELACGQVTLTPPTVMKAFKVAGGAPLYLWMSGASYDGAFSMEVQMTDAVISPFDQCDEGTLLTGFDPSGITIVEGDTSQATNGSSAPCDYSGNGGELVYHVNLAVPTSLKLSLEPAPGSSLVPVLYASSSCLLETHLGCRSASAPSPLDLELRHAEGDLYIFVDSMDSNSEGPFRLTLAATPSNPKPANDSCANTPPTLAPGLYRGLSTADARDDYRGLCEGYEAKHDGGDLVYAIEATETSMLTARVRRDAASVDFQPVVYIRSACESSAPSDEIACNVGLSGLASASGIVEEGTHYVIVDGVGGSYGSFDLELSLTPRGAVPETCAGAVELKFELGDTRIIDADTKGANGDASSTRLSLGNGPDLVYYFTLGEPALVAAELAFASIEGSAVLYLRDASCSSTDFSAELAAASSVDGGVARLSKELREGTYYLWVDSELPLRGAFQLRVTRADFPAGPPNNICANADAAPIAWAGNRGHVTGSVAHGTDHTSASCLADGESGPEAIFAIDVPQGAARSLTISLERTDESDAPWTPALYLRTACESQLAEDERGCASAPEGTLSLFLGHAALPRYYLYVDSATAQGGSFALTFEWGDAIADSCTPTSDIPRIALSGETVKVTGNTQNLTADLSAAACATEGPDAVYELVVPAGTTGKDLLVMMTFPEQQNLNPVVAVRPAGCALLEGEVCQEGINGQSILRLGAVAPGSYWVWLGGSYPFDAGNFEAEFTLVDSAQTLSGTCDAPIPLTLSNGTATIISDTNLGYSNVNPVCGNGWGIEREQVFSLQVSSAPAIVDLFVAPTPGSRFKPSLSAGLGECPYPGQPDNCVFARTPGTPVSLSVEVPSPQILYVLVDGASFDAIGEFALTARVRGSTNSQPNTCAAALPLFSSSSPSRAQVAGRIDAPSTNLSQGSCGAPQGMHGPEHVYAFTLTQAQRFSAKVLAQFAAPSLYLRHQNCSGAASDEHGCAMGKQYTSALTLASLPAGNWFLFVDTPFAESFGEYLLFAELGEALPSVPNSTCAAALPLALDPAGRASHWENEISRSENRTSASCLAANGPDHLFSVSAAGGKLITARVSAPGFAPIVSIRESCVDPLSEAACAATTIVGAGATATATTPSGATKDWYVIVDSPDSSGSGEFTLDVSVTDPPVRPSNDLCVEPFPSEAILSLSPGETRTLTGTLGDAAHDSHGQCGTMPGPDKVYLLRLTAPSLVTIDGLAAGFAPSVYLRTQCDDASAAASRGCRSAPSASEPLHLEAALAKAGDYYLWVDTAETVAAGSFWLDLRATAMSATLPTNDTCQGADELGLSGTVFAAHRDVNSSSPANLALANHNSTGTGPCEMALGRDLVYTFEVQPGHPIRFSASVTGTSFSPIIYLRSQCEGGDTLGKYGCARAAGPGEAAQVHYAHLPPGRYFLWVDSASLDDAGEFALDVLAEELPASAVTPGRANCSSPKELVFAGSAPRIATASGTFLLDSSESGATGTCSPFGDGLPGAGAMMGADEVFHFELTAPQQATLYAAADVNYVLYLRGHECRDTSMASEYGCRVGPSSTEPLVLPALAAGHWYLFIDLEGTEDVGSFTVKVELSEPTPAPVNDRCEGAIPLRMGEHLIASTLGATDDYAFGRRVDLANYCEGQYYAGNGPDVVFSYTAESAAPFSVSVDREAKGPNPSGAPESYYDPTVWIGTSCTELYSCVAATLGGASLPAQVRYPVVGQTYYIFVDGWAGTAGGFTISIESLTP